MKRAAIVIWVLGMLGMSSSSNGYFMVYKMNGSIRGVDDVNKKDSVHFKAYLVMNFADDVNELIDANMIIYGRNSDDRRVYTVLNASDSNGFLNARVLFRNRRNFYDISGNEPFNFKFFAMGEVHKTNIGLPSREKVVSTFESEISSEDAMFLSAGERITGVGWINATMYGLATKSINDPDNDVAPKTQDGIVETLIEILEDDHYRPAVLVEEGDDPPPLPL